MSELVQIRRGPAPPAIEHRAPAGAPRVYLETLGCQMNEADSALILGRLRAGGYATTADPADADVVLLNTCAIREKAEDRVYGRTSQLLAHRATHPGLVFGITGCMAEHLRERVRERAPHITLVAGPDAYRDIAGLVDRARAGETVIDVELDRSETYEGLDGEPDDDGVSGHVTVQRGCDKFCSFCVVPYTRGRERAVAPREVLRNVRTLADRGYREVVLLGQTVNSYRHDTADFADLLRTVATVDGIARIRFTSPYPLDFDDALIDVMAGEPKVCPQVHLPVQSGSDRVLERMGRGYDRAQYLDIVARLRDRIPGIALSTDVMVGFCGETEEDHAATLALMDEVGFDGAFMFRYSDRGITKAARKLEDDVGDETKARRLAEVIALQERHGELAHRRWLGREVEVLVSGVSRRGDRLVGRTPHFHKVLLPLDCGRPGELVRATVSRTNAHSLWAD